MPFPTLNPGTVLLKIVPPKFSSPILSTYGLASTTIPLTIAWFSQRESAGVYTVGYIILILHYLRLMFSNHEPTYRVSSAPCRHPYQHTTKSTFQRFKYHTFHVPRQTGSLHFHHHPNLLQ